MIIIVFLSIAILMPVLAYLLQPLANQKALVFLFTILFFGGFIFNFTSSHPFLGSWVNATESEAVSYAIKNDEELDDFIKQRYGTLCALGEKTESEQSGVYDISIDSSNWIPGDYNSCFVNYVTKIKYSPSLIF